MHGWIAPGFDILFVETDSRINIPYPFESYASVVSPNAFFKQSFVLYLFVKIVLHFDY